MKNFCLIVIAVQYGPWCPANKESWYVLKIMGSYFSGITNRNKLPLPVSLSFSHVYPEQKVVDDNIIKCLGSDNSFALWNWMEVFHLLCIDKCHENELKFDMLLRGLVPGLVILNYG